MQPVRKCLFAPASFAFWPFRRLCLFARPLADCRRIEKLKKLSPGGDARTQMDIQMGVAGLFLGRNERIPDELGYRFARAALWESIFHFPYISISIGIIFPLLLLTENGSVNKYH